MSARVVPIAILAVLVSTFFPPAEQQNQLPSASAQVPADLPLRTWIPRPLASVGAGAMPAGRSGKHARWIFDGKRKRMVIAGGDWSPMPSLPTDSYFYDGQNTVWALDVATGKWEELSPYCRRAGEVQPARPDTVTWVYDSKRDRYIIMPGYYFGIEKALQACPNAATPVLGALLFNPETRAWERPPFAPPPSGYGGDNNASFGVYDPVTDALYRLYYEGGWGCNMDILYLGSNAWERIYLGRQPFSQDLRNANCVRDMMAIDVEKRNIYAINLGPTTFLLRYAIDEKRAYQEPAPPASFFVAPQGNEALLAFDPGNRVLLAPNIADYGGEVLGLYIYHVDKKRWEVEPIPNRGVVAGHRVMGNVLGFDPVNNALVLIGGHSIPEGSRLDAGAPTENPKVYWLYRYGNAPVQTRKP